MKSIDNSQVTENTEEVTRFCANLVLLMVLPVLQSRFSVRRFMSVEDFSISLHVTWLTSFLHNGSRLCDCFTVE